MDLVEKKLPFPLVRIVIEYLGLLEPLYEDVITNISLHFADKYCKRCGEYITSRNYTSKRPVHLACREKWYTPPRERTKNYDIVHLRAPDIFPSMTQNDKLCPVVFYSTQPKNYYRLIFKTRTPSKSNLILSFLDNVSVYFDYHENVHARNIFKNKNFYIIPNIYEGTILNINNFDYIQLQKEVFYIMNGITRTELIEKCRHLKPSQPIDVLRWSILLHPELGEWLSHHVHINDLYTIVKNIKCRTKYAICSIIGFRFILYNNSKLFRNILYDFPHILDSLHERDIVRFFKRNRNWFCRFVNKRPEALNYITLVYNTHNDDKYNKSDNSTYDVPS